MSEPLLQILQDTNPPSCTGKAELELSRTLNPENHHSKTPKYRSPTSIHLNTHRQARPNKALDSPGQKRSAVPSGHKNRPAGCGTGRQSSSRRVSWPAQSWSQVAGCSPRRTSPRSCSWETPHTRALRGRCCHDFLQPGRKERVMGGLKLNRRVKRVMGG